MGYNTHAVVSWFDFLKITSTSMKAILRGHFWFDSPVFASTPNDIFMFTIQTETSSLSDIEMVLFGHISSDLPEIPSRHVRVFLSSTFSGK